MLKYIYKNLIYKKGRLALILFGAAILSSGLSYLVGIGQTSKMTVQQALQEKWRSSYDILVIPKDIVTPLDKNLNIMESNQISNYSGGISIKDWEEIKKINDVEIAAPVSILGWRILNLPLPTFESLDPGVYRFVTKVKTSDGLKNYTKEVAYYLMNPFSLETVNKFPPTLWDDMWNKYGLNFTPQSIAKAKNLPFTSVYFYKQAILVGAIDPEEEAKLVGLNKSIVEGRYFSKSDIPKTDKPITIPVLVMNWPFYDISYEYYVEKLKLPKIEDIQLLYFLKEKGGKSYLDKTLAKKNVFENKLSAEKMHEIVKKQLLEGSEGSNGRKLVLTGGTYLLPTKVNYNSIEAPYKDRWPIALEAVPQNVKDEEKYRWLNLILMDVPVFRPLKIAYGEEVVFKTIGFYDVKKLQIATDPLSELPMEQYRPAQARVVLDDNGKPLNPVVTLKPTGSPLEIITSPPLILTTIESAEVLLGDKPISAIRIKIKGVEHFSSESEKKAENIAKEITARTGHKAYVTLGSSPRNILVHANKIGYLEQLWIQLGTAMTIVKENTLAFGIFIAILIVEAILFVLATSIVNILSRKNEFAILFSVGWSTDYIQKLIVKEGAIIGASVGIIGVILSLIAWHFLNRPAETNKLLEVFLISLFSYTAGTAISSFTIKEENISEILKSGEVKRVITKRYSKNLLLNFLLSSIFNRPWRTLLSILSASIPTFLLSVLLYIKIHLNNVLHMTLLGEYISLELQPQHYLIGIISVIIAVVTISDLISLNITDKRFELSLLLAVGWRNNWVRGLIISEGAIYGFASGIIGIIGSNFILSLLYKSMHLSVEIVLLMTMLSTVIGSISALIPFELKVKYLTTSGALKIQ
ncbi:putative ABC transport system permease protein [Thermoanaerobacter kivui]|uniref:Putative ABC transport system permease protein n=1 Tax=Thermoanaerobacter kivui TaxID=2325 RepID=A0A097AP84_THEKI|nr:FtsX-like permease family protein [Thermoanaerobacter kivui]AIS51615.1 putative ABC transport system permease protein [Thermoanaerobacter kivui]